MCLAVGGVGLDNMAQWAQAGADGFGIGSLLYTPGMSLKQLRNNAQLWSLSMTRYLSSEAV